MLAAACLYFFENNTGTRIILICSMLVPLLPWTRGLFFSGDAPEKGENAVSLTVTAFTARETEEPGDVRPYRAGDPVRRIHWKLSARTGKILIRETEPEREQAEDKKITVMTQPARGGAIRKRAAWMIAAAGLLCVILLAAVPEARRGVQALMNRLYAESEKANPYVYSRYSVGESQAVWPAAVLIGCAVMVIAAEAVLLRSRLIPLLAAILCAFAQAYFGLSFPGWLHILLLGLLMLCMIRKPATFRAALTCGAMLLVVSGLVMALVPGVDPDTEAASENLRDRLSTAAGGTAGATGETGGGERETRHVNTRSLETGEGEARAEREYRLETVEEEQISIPRQVDYLKIILGLLAAIAAVVLPFAPFVLLNARRRKAREARKAFEAENPGEALTAIFRQVITWLETTRNGGGNRLYRQWTELLPETMPEGYGERFLRCAGYYEEAAYSDHLLPEEAREQALSLLQETEKALWQEADWKTRFRLKYWMCLQE